MITNGGLVYMSSLTTSQCFLSIFMYPCYRGEISSHYRRIIGSDTYAKCVSELENLYVMMKKSSAIYYNGVEMSFLYDSLKKRVVSCENLLENTSIIDSAPIFSYNNEYFRKTKYKDLKNTQERLDYIVWCARRNIVDRFRKFYGEDVFLEDFFLVNECLTVSVYVEILCEKLGIWCKTIKIPPAYTDDIKLYDGDGFHYFNIVKIDGFIYIVDCTYRQFFKLDVNLLERLGVPSMNGCDAGVYMTIGNSRKKTAKDILQNGWVVASPENAKNYLDGFTLSFRNGLYYERNGKVNYDVPYTLNDYKKFFEGKDNQINHESYRCLGVQEEPLEDYKLNFKINRK